MKTNGANRLRSPIQSTSSNKGKPSPTGKPIHAHSVIKPQVEFDKQLAKLRKNLNQEQVQNAETQVQQNNPPNTTVSEIVNQFLSNPLMQDFISQGKRNHLT